MNGKLGQFKENLRHISIKSVVVAVIVLAVTIGMVTFVGRHYYDTEKEVLLQQGELNALESAKEYDKCLITRANIVTLVGCTIEDMINSGSRNDKIEQYLTGQTDNVIETLDPSSTGLYGWINDTYGHQTGDSVIIAVADALRSTFRSNDITMRLGGDEFGVFAVGIVRKELAEAIIRRLFSRIDSIEIPELKGKKISISVGIVFSSGKTKSFDELYACADTAMYISKKTSGNCLTLSE